MRLEPQTPDPNTQHKTIIGRNRRRIRKRIWRKGRCIAPVSPALDPNTQHQTLIRWNRRRIRRWGAWVGVQPHVLKWLE